MTGHTIGIDLGGTNLKAGVLDPSGHLVLHGSIPTEADGGVDHVIRRMAALVEELADEAGLQRQDIEGIGVGAPGPLSHERGIVYNAPNLPGWVNVPLRKRLSELTGLPVVVENDANAAAFGEFVAGADRGVRSLVLLTLGTGIGSGIVLEGQLWRGCDEAGAEMGHVILIPDGRPCPCGQRGCFERYASASAVAERLAEAVRAGQRSALREQIEAGRTPGAREVLAAASAGDEPAARIWDETCYYLALGCITIEHLISPQRIVLSGGLTNAGKHLLEPVRAHFARLRWHLTQPSVEIVLSTLGTEAGIIGAAALARKK